METRDTKYAPRNASRGRKTKAVNIALDPLTRMTLDIAARLSKKSLARYVVDAAMQQVNSDNQRFNQRMTEDGWQTVAADNAIQATAEKILGKSDAHTFMRMAHMAGGLLNDREVKLLQRIYNAKEFWLSDPKKSLSILPDGSEPKKPVVNWQVLEERWDSLIQSHEPELVEGRAILASLKPKKGN